VCQRLAHKMIINIFGTTAQTIENMQKFGHTHPPQSPLVPVAKRAAHIAYIGYFYINLAVHNLSSFTAKALNLSFKMLSAAIFFILYLKKISHLRWLIYTF
jgi:hypothetical protein